MAGRARIRTTGVALLLLALVAAPGARADLIITEMLASNTAYQVENDTPDLVEILNTGPNDVTLGGAGTGNRMYLTDDPYGDYRRWWKFPLVTILKAGEYLTVACDASGKFGMHANFRIDKSVGIVALMDTDTNGRRIIDLVEYHLQYENISYARFENGDGTHAWHRTSRPTLFFDGQAACATRTLLMASAVYCGDPAELCPPSSENILEETFIPDIDDFDYSPKLVKATDPVVVVARVGPAEARIAVDLHYVVVPPGGTAGQEVVVAMHDDGEGPDAVYDRQGVNVGANDTWWAASIPAQSAGTTVRFWATSAWKGGAPAACADREPGIDPVTQVEKYSLYTVENTEAKDVCVNEVLAVNQTGIRNFRGQYADWIEIRNEGDEQVDLAGLYLTTSPRNPTQWAFPLDRSDLTRIPAKGYVIVWCDGELTPIGVPELHATFTLDGTNDRIYLANAQGVFDGIDWQQDPRRPGPCDLTTDAQDPDISLGRVPDGGDVLARFIPPTPGAANPAGPAPVIASLAAGPDDPSCEIPCGSAAFVVMGENLASPARVLVDDGSSTIDAVQDVTAGVQTLGNGSLLVPDPRCGVGARKIVWVYQGSPDAYVAAKARFRCVPQITGMTPASPQGDEVVTLDLCGFDVLASVLIDGEAVPFTPDPRPGAAPTTVAFFLPACEGTGKRIEVIDTDTYAQETCVCGTCECTEPRIVAIEPSSVPEGGTIEATLECFETVTAVRIDGADVAYTQPAADRVRIDLPEAVKAGDHALEVCDGAGCASKAFRVAGGGVRFVRGDGDGDGQFTLGDPVVILGYMFSGGTIGCAKTADLDDDGQLLLNDPVYLLNYLFSDGPDPKSPFPSCGEDPTADAIDCASYDC
ncbi:MAG: lamin tail domain-containing protein [Planctomycetes bacterium]|nr:lamin tail domain-containing protein [Planctomycetota bacterium]